MTVPEIVIYVRHSAGCKYAGDEMARRCDCRKHLRWTQHGKQHRRSAATRSWAEAEQVKREIEDQLAGKKPEVAAAARSLGDAVVLFLQDKTVQGVTSGVIKKYTLELSRLRAYCERQNVFVVQGISRELMTGFCSTWATHYPSSYTRAKVRERLRSFLRYCYEAQWIERVPALPKVQIVEPPTMPLSSEEYARLLDAVYIAEPLRWDGKKSTQGLSDKMREKIHALFQLMRYSGLAIRDAVTLERAGILYDAQRKIYRVVTSRQKTGVDVSVAIPAAVAEELLRVANGNPRYIFWDPKGGSEETTSKTWASRYVRPVFEAAGIRTDGHMLSHRLRDTFACDLLQKGVPLEEVSKLLGHESIKTTEKHYAKWVKARQDRLDDLVTATWQTTNATEARPN